jgi:two-component system NtrC family sensor kinase
VEQESSTLLIVDEAPAIRGLLERAAGERGYSVVTADSLPAALDVIDAHAIDAALVDVILGADDGLDVIRRLRQRDPDAEVIVISAGGSLASAIAAYDLDAFAFVPKPFDLDYLFSTLERALDRRRMAIDNRRLVRELQILNDVAEALASSLDVREVLQQALERLAFAFDCQHGIVRLKSGTNRYEVLAQLGFDADDLRAFPAWHESRPTSEALATRAPAGVADTREEQRPVPAPLTRHGLRSLIAVPVITGDEVVAVLGLGSRTPRRFRDGDRQLLMTVARHLAVAITNGELYAVVRRGKFEWERTFDAIGDPIAVFDACGGLVRANAALAGYTGLPFKSLTGRTCGETGFCAAAFPACDVGRAARDGATTRREVTTADGRIFEVATLPVEAGAEAAVVQVAKNVTDERRSARQLQQVGEELARTNARLVATLDQLKSAQAQLLQAEKLSAIGQLVAGVAHELNNPLTSVIGYAQLLQDEMLAPRADDRPRREIAEDLRRIAVESERAATIVRNLLAFARRQTSERALQDMADLVARVLSLRTYDLRLENIEISTVFEPHVPPVFGDGNQIQQALLNLVLNAEQAMRGQPGAHRLELAVRYDAASRSVITTVTDSGHGIERVNLSRVFDPFFTTRPVGEGTGLGLSICYGIVRDHGGQIRVESEPGRKTTFSIQLPARTGDEPPRTLLVAHGEAAARDFLSAALVAWGHRVGTAATSAEALASVDRGGLDAAIVDRTLLAADLDGWGARWRAAGAPPLVLASPGAGEEDDVDRFVHEHGRAVVAPPYHLDALHGAVRAVVAALSIKD